MENRRSAYRLDASRFGSLTQDALVPMSRPSYRSFKILGFKITPLTLAEQLELVAAYIKTGEQCVLAHLNLHGMYMSQKEPAISYLHEESATFVAIDGMPLVLFCRLAGIKGRRRHRVTNVDLFWPLMSLAVQSGWRIYYIGSTPEVLAKALTAIHDRLPTLVIRGHHGYIEIDDDDVIAEVNEFRPDLVIVGMGMGLQERWILKNKRSLAPASLMPVGALMEFIAGTVSTPPRWAGPLGLEWLFRLKGNPRRFWRRYLIEPWAVVWNLAEQAKRERFKPLK